MWPVFGRRVRLGISLVLTNRRHHWQQLAKDERPIVSRCTQANPVHSGIATGLIYIAVFPTALIQLAGNCFEDIPVRRLESSPPAQQQRLQPPYSAIADRSNGMVLSQACRCAVADSERRFRQRQLPSVSEFRDISKLVGDEFEKRYPSLIGGAS